MFELIKLYVFGCLLLFGFLFSYQLTFTRKEYHSPTNDRLQPDPYGGYEIIKGNPESHTYISHPGEIESDKLFKPSLIFGVIVFLFFIFCLIFGIFDYETLTSFVDFGIIIIITGLGLSTLGLLIYLIFHMRKLDYNKMLPIFIYTPYLGISLFIILSIHTISY